MPNPLTTALAFLALALAGCQYQDAHMTVDTSDMRGADAPAHDLRYKQNPQPKQAYRITIEIKNAPGPFESVKGFAQYAAPNCRHITDHLAGASAIPERTLPINYVKVDDSTYVGIVHLDAMLDEDYFGREICRWEFTSSRIELKAFEDEYAATFVAYYDLEQLASSQERKSFYWKRGYPIEEVPGFNDSGLASPEEFKPEIKHELFSIIGKSTRIEEWP